MMHSFSVLVSLSLGCFLELMTSCNRERVGVNFPGMWVASSQKRRADALAVVIYADSVLRVHNSLLQCRSGFQIKVNLSASQFEEPWNSDTEGQLHATQSSNCLISSPLNSSGDGWDNRQALRCQSVILKNKKVSVLIYSLFFWNAVTDDKPGSG